MTQDKRIDELCHQVLNLISIMKGLIRAVNTNLLDANANLGKMAHRCGETEEAIAGLTICEASDQENDLKEM